jgi:hypothetical protein
MSNKFPTDNLQNLRNGALFWAGELIQIHDVGNYTIVEFIRANKIQFSCYVGGKNINVHTDSIDAALLTCIAWNNSGTYNRDMGAARYAAKILNVSG